MKSSLMNQLEQSLALYSLHAEEWDPHDGDTFITCGAREFIEQHRDHLSLAQIEQLEEADRQFVTLLAQTRVETEEVGDLRRLIDTVMNSDWHRYAA